MKEKEFMDLLGQITANFPNKPYDYCLKQEQVIANTWKEQLKCWECSDAVFNDGICDPL